MRSSQANTRFFSALATTIKIVDFILAGGGTFKNLVWIALAVMIGIVLERHWHFGMVGWLVYALLAFVGRFLIESALVVASAWVGRHLDKPDIKI